MVLCGSGTPGVVDDVVRRWYVETTAIGLHRFAVY
jgi:hypothetical protein